MTMQTHLALRTLKGIEDLGKSVQVLFAVQPNRKAILFIHGYGGDVIKTWSDFPRLLPGRPKSIQHDIIFYGYDGLRADMNASAAIFRAFLDKLFKTTNSFLGDNLPSSAQRADDFQYDELMIVSHSLGAVIARRALLDATDRSDWVAKTRLVLYAPAHKGANVVDLAMETVSSIPFVKVFAKPMAAVLRFQSPLIDQLKPGSPSLKKLLEDTEMATKGGINTHLIARKVVIAQYEKIVQNDSFCNDPPPDAIPKATHMSVCKPKKDFLQPLILLETCL